MKTVLITFCLILFTTVCIGQNLEITFIGLEKAGSQTTIDASTIHLQNQPSPSSSNSRSNVNKKMMYVVTRKSTSESNAIENAFARGIVINKAIITIKNMSGQSIHTLNNVSVSSYGVEYNSNKNHIEEFTLIFESRQVK
ncbi:hypothetical protein ACFQO1_08655 [Jejudonia soesokkakensis]|uniref:Uncharacterized protein n=1 Tax=Jejudonia soesokkakensis TaxID=1323432 RepID=A0ABW2MV99_9FLAO